MLKINFGECEGEVYNPPMYFKYQYDKSWITDELSQKMIEDVDKSHVVGENIIESPVLGTISPLQLSGGVKTLILIAHDDTGKIFNASAGGDNCAKWIVEIAKMKDITIALHNIMDFSGLDFEACILNDDKIVNSFDAYVSAAIRFLK